MSQISEPEDFGPVEVLSDQKISADLRAEDDVPYRGCIEAFDAGTGIEGWAIDLRSPNQALSLEFVVDGLVMMEFGTRLVREDLTAFFPQIPVSPGFLLTLNSFDTIKTFIKIHPDADFVIRIAGTSFVLPKEDRIPRLSTIVNAHLRTEQDNDEGVSLLGHLTHLRSLAKQLLRYPLRPTEEMRSGFIEAICVEDQFANLFWCLGWTKEERLEDMPALIADRQKWMTSMSVVTYVRDDLPDDARAFIGVIHSDWRSQADSQPVLYFGAQCRSHLTSISNLPRISKSAIAEQIELARARTPVGKWADLLRLFHGSHSWFSAGTNLSDVRAAIEHFYVVPDFGCFIAGWILSPLREVEGFAIKMGDTVMTMEKSSLYFRPRPDLGIAFPDAASYTARAGFCCFFQGKVDITPTGKPLLKIFLEQQGATIHSIEPAQMRRLGYSEPIDSVLSLYPAIETEPFLPELSRVICDEYRRRRTSFTVNRLVPARHTLIVALSEDRHDNLLALEDLHHHAASKLPANCGIAIVANASAEHGDLVGAFATLSSTLLNRCSLVFVPEIDGALYILTELLLSLKTDCFVFLAASHYFTSSGWAAASTLLSNNAKELTFLGVEDPTTGISVEMDSSCFGWSRRPFSTWALTMPTIIRGHPAFDDYPSNATPNSLVPAAVFFSKSVRCSRMESIVNRMSRVNFQ